MKKTIAIVTPNLESGGSERIASRLSRLLSEKYNVIFIVFNETKKSYNFSGKLYNLNLPSKNGIFKIFVLIMRIIKLKKVIRNENVNLVLSFGAPANRALSYVNTKGKKVYSCRGYGDFIKYSKFYHKQIKKNNIVLFNSQELMNNYLTLYPNDCNGVKTLYNIFDTENIIKQSQEELTLEEQKLFESKNVIISVSHFSESKGHWNLIKSFEIVKETLPDATLVLVGHRGNLENKIKEMATKSIYKDDIIFLGYQSNPFKYIYNSTVYASTSLNEGFPNAIVEALICNCPVVATNCLTGPSEILFNEYKKDFSIEENVIADNGILTPPFDNEVDFDLNNKSSKHYLFADALLKMLTDDNLRIEFKRNINNNIIRFSEEVQKDIYFEFIEELIN